MLDIKPHSLSKEEILKFLYTTEKGLTEEEAKKRLSLFGKNLFEDRKVTKGILYLKQLNTPFSYILFTASLLTFVAGDYVDTAFILAVILVNGFISYFKETKLFHMFRALVRLSEITVSVLRNGKEVKVPVSEVVIGDIVLLYPGDIAPADIRLIESKNLKVDESILTGEIKPVEKNADVVLHPDIPDYERINIVFKGSVVLEGFAKGVVYATGVYTELAKAGKEIENLSAETPLKKAVKSFLKKWFIFISAVIAFIFILGIIQGRDFYSLSLLSASELVSALPEGFLVVMLFILVVGAVKLAKRRVLMKYVPAIEVLGNTGFIITDKTGLITEGKLQVDDFYSVEKIKLILGCALCNEGKEDNPVDKAIFEWLDSIGFDWKKVQEEYKRLWFYPFDKKKKIVASIHDIYGKKYLFVKGAFETVSKMCSCDTGELQIIHDSMAENGFKVIAVGYAEIEKIPESIEEAKVNIAGLLGLSDKIKKGVKKAAKEAKKAGIRIIMTTKDNLITGVAIARKAGIYEPGDVVLRGKDLDKFSSEDLYEVLKILSVVARITPQIKYKIVKTLQLNGEVVALTGKDLPDIPALRTADIAIALGSSVSAVKEISKMIIVDDKLESIVNAIKYGRNFALNLRKTVYYLISGSIGEVGLITLSFIFGLPLPLNPVQILWINLITDSFQDKAFAFSREEEETLFKKPEKPEKVFFDKKQLFDVLYSGIIMAVISFVLFFYSLKTYDIKHAVSVAFTSLVINHLFNGVQAITVRPVFEDFKSSITYNRYFLFGTVVALILQLIAVYIIPDILHISPLNLKDWVLIISSGWVFFLILEAKKMIERKREKKKK